MASKKKTEKKTKSFSTSKLILFAVAILCIEIIIFCEYMMWSLQDASSLYVLIGVPVSLIPVVLGYYNKSKAENTAGGIVYDSAMMQIGNQDSAIDPEESDGTVG